MSEAVIKVAGVHKRFTQEERSVHALRGLDLEVSTGGFVAVMGASGSGKSTLLNVIAGLTAPSEGSVSIGGQNIAKLDDQALTIFRRQHLGIVFQAYNLVPVLTASENVALPLILDGVARAEAQQRAAAQLERVGLADRASHRPDALSGGEQQRVAIARALVNNPTLILADEPTGNLDSVAADMICGLLTELHREEQRSIMLITHEASVACHAERVVVLADGVIRGELSGDALSSPAQLAQAYHALVTTEPAA